MYTEKAEIIMKDIAKQTEKGSVALGKQRSYAEIVEFLDNHWSAKKADKQLACIKKLNAAFNNVAEQTNTILVTGTNGKSLTIHFATRLLREEGLTVGSFQEPHILTYNELISLNGEIIPNKAFADIGNEILNTAESLELKPTSHDILVMMALLYFKEHNVDVAILEVDNTNTHMATHICSPKVAAITRVTPDNVDINSEEIKGYIEQMVSIIKPGTHVISADQSKLNLQTMLEMVEAKHGIWAMPIRKLSPLAYPFEQLHGRCSALAERIAHIYVNAFTDKGAIVVNDTLLTRKKGQRGRPTLEAKRQLELNPQKTIDQFWKESECTIAGRFQLLDKEKPTMLIDSADNLDAFKNLLLGIRLLHYKRPLKGLTLVIGCNNPELNIPEFLKLLRYFFKKTSGQVILCPVALIPGHQDAPSWDVEKVTNEIKSLKIKAKAYTNFKEAFEAAQKTVDERNGLLVVTGSTGIVTEFWRYKGLRKL